MEIEAKITSKGQITVPLEVRKELGVKPGDKIRFEKNDDHEITVRPVRKESPFAKYRGIGTPGIGPGLDAVIKAVREMRGFDPDDPSVE
ncbi:MAG: AbrB/MazE/SpoVT family DNA-binding domain-containing protein [Acidobacteria bacterium]|nr:AbrB/MazE/SpoVT family DNA-binding domain-containing protein [Acidobacteriota bacterium]